MEDRERPKTARRPDRIETLRSISPISYGIERIFRGLALLSPERLAGPTRVGIQSQQADNVSRLRVARKRGRHIEAYLAGWLALEAMAVAFGTTCPNRWVAGTFAALLVVRILDIIQTTGNISLFDRLQINWRYYYLENTVRTILLSLVNYVELIVCFGFIYCLAGRGGVGLAFKDSPFDGYYFSGATQLTIGYGDIVPGQWVKYLALFQGFLGFLYGILILGRFIALLPESPEEA